MKSKFEILILKYEQPDESVWKEILEFAKKWNLTTENKFINDEPSELAIYFLNESNEEAEVLKDFLKIKYEVSKWIWIETFANNPTKEEKEAFDFIQIIGGGYPDSFLLNESTALSSMNPCETCGTIHSHLVTQKEFLQVNEAFLDGNSYSNDRYTPNGLDIINIQHGGLLVSEKVKELISDNKKLNGYSFLKVIESTGKTSNRLFQLIASIIILVPDSVQNKNEYCPTCGTVLSTLTRGFAIKKEKLMGSSFFSRGPSGISSIYVSNSLYHFLKSEKIRGLTPVQGINLIKD